MATRRELKQAIGERYRAAGMRERGQILDKFTRVTGYHRKHAVRVLNRPFVHWPPRPRPRIYDAAVRQDDDAEATPRRVGQAGLS